MKSYSQNREDLFVLSYFGSHKGTLLEIGSNDGVTLSNSLLLIENGWHAHLIEPCSIFDQLDVLHKDNPRVECHYIGLGAENGLQILYESGAHVHNGNDHGLVSSLIKSETDRWRNSGVGFIENTVKIWDFKTFWSFIGNVKFDFISIDVEGVELIILQQIDLNEVGCKCICIEWNSNPELQIQFSHYILPFGFKLVHFNRENLIYVR